MTLKIVRSAEDGSVFTLSGRIELEHVSELQNLVDFAAAKNTVVLDLNEVRLVDREAVQFLARSEAQASRSTIARPPFASRLRRDDRN